MIKIKINYFVTTIILISIIVLYLVYLSIKMFRPHGIEGSYIRISGDTNQSKYIDNTYNGSDNIFRYYDDNKKLINEGTFDIYGVSRHTNSYSKCESSYMSSGNSFGVCNGFAEKKHNKLNVKYTSYHKYYTFNNMVYYENIYFFDDDTISYALYKKI